MVAIRRMHLLQYLVLAGLLPALTLSTGGGLRAAGPAVSYASVIVLLLVLLLLVVGGLYLLYKRIRPNLRRPEAENLRVYQSAVLLRNSFLALVSLPPLLLYYLTTDKLNLVFYALLLLVLCVLTLPTERNYRRWLLT